MSLSDHTRGIVDETLAGFLEEQRARTRATSPVLLPVCEAICALTTRGGKRLRPSLAVAGYLAAGGDRPDDAARAAASLELLQTYLLIHDDWMDGDVERRGGPTVHVALSRQLGSHLGPAAAVLAGDLASSWARQLLVRAPFAAPALLAALREYALFEGEVVEGQELDVLGARGSVPIEELYDRKTGSYTVRGPLRLGAALAGAGPALLARLDAFARPVGRAFQIRDDLLGLFGDPASTGKSVATDLRAGKRTWIIEVALDLVGHDTSGAIQRVLGDPEASAADLEDAVALIRACGAEGRAEARVQELLAEARSQLPALGAPPDAAALLDQLVVRLCRRDA